MKDHRVYLAYLPVLLIVALTIRQRSLVRDEAIALVFGVFFVAALAADFAWNSARRRELIESAVIQPALLLLSLLPMLWYLFLTWWGGIYQGSYVSGNLIPYSDAEDWVQGAKSLLATGKLTEWSMYRPLGICMFATLLAVTDHNYQQALIVLVLFASAANFFAAREVWRTGGIAAAVLFTALSTFAIAPWLPLFMTETPGYALGCIGYAYLLQGFRTGSFRICVVGLGFLTLGMLTRTGSLFVIPFVALYMVYFFRGGFKRFILNAGAVAAVCAAALGLNGLTAKLTGPKGVEFQGNAYYQLYGIASGGKDWSYVLEELPEIHEFSSNDETVRYVKSLFLRKFASDPSVFFRTVASSVLTATRHFPALFFTEAGTIWQPPAVIPGALALLAFVLLVYPACRGRSPWGFLVPCAIAIILSFPFIPHSTGLRFNAVTFPFHAALAAAAIALITGRWRGQLPSPPAESLASLEHSEGSQSAGAERAFTMPGAVQAAFAALLTATLTVIPVLLSFRSNDSPLPRSSRSEENGLWREIAFYHNPRSGVAIEVSDRAGEIVQASLAGVIRASLGREVDLRPHLRPGDYLCDVFLPGETSFYVLFSEIPRTKGMKAGYIKAALRPVAVEKSWPKVYRVEHYEFIGP